MPEEFEKRLLAVLYADVVGYSRMSGDDELATHRLLRESLDEFTATIRKFGGEVVNYAGDAILAKFHSVSAAVECAVSVQQDALTSKQADPSSVRIKFRIGLNLGEVIIDRDDIYGDGVNVAARLEALADPGGICVSEAVCTAIGNKLPYEFADMGEKQVKNIARPVHCYKVMLEGSTQVKSGRKSGLFDQKLVIVGIILLIAIVVSLVWYSSRDTKNTSSSAAVVTDSTLAQTKSVSEADQRPSIAVLPFANLSGDQEQEYFSDGVTNDIITDLSQISSLQVIASNSVFVYKGTPVKVQDVARDLAVSHVLEGSVQKAGNHVRINVQLIDAVSGHHLWAERFDRELVNIFTLQDEVSKRIVSTLAVKLTSGEQQRLDKERLANPEAYDSLLRGLQLFRRFTQENNEESRRYFEQAVAFDPEFARAYADIGLSHAIDIQLGWSPPDQEKFAKAFEYVNKALELDPYMGQVHFAASMLHMAQKRHELSVASAASAVEHNPNYADGWAQYAQALIYAGQPEEGLIKLARAKELNPRYAFFYTWIEGKAYMSLLELDKAEKAFLQVIELNAHFVGAHKTLAALYAQQGKIDDAEFEAAEILSLFPEFTISSLENSALYNDPEVRKFYVEGLRKAGLPE